MVQAINLGNVASDAFLVPPENQLATEYRAITYRYASTGSYQGPYEVAIVGVYDATDVSVTLRGPSAVTLLFEGNIYSSGETISFTLNKYKTAQVRNLICICTCDC